MLRPGTFALTVLLGLLSGLGPFSVDMYLASMPDIGRLLDASPSDVQLTLSSYLIGFAVGQIFYGPVSDRYGRKPVLIAALVLFCLASAACAAAPNIAVLIAARSAQALGGAGAIVLARAVVRDLYSGARAGRELSLMGAVMGLAPIVAPVIGGTLQTMLGWRANFIFLVAFGLASLACVWLLLPETLRRRDGEPISVATVLRTYGGLLGHRSYVAHLAIVTATYSGLFAWIAGATFVLQDIYGLTAFEFGVAFAVASAGYLVGTAMAARLVVRLGLDRTIGLGALALAAGGLAMVAGIALGLDWRAALIAPMALYLAGLGLVTPQAMAGALTPFPERAGAASSLIGFIQQSAGALAAAAVGYTLGATAWPLVIALAATGVVALTLWAMTRQVRTRTFA